MLKSKGHKRGFTLIELVVVLAVLGLLGYVAGTRFGTFDFWKEEAFVRRLSETMRFVHHQAIADSSAYVIEFDLENQSYQVGLFKPDSSTNTSVTATQDDGLLTTELGDFLLPDYSDDKTLIPPPSFPSLAERQYIPAGVRIYEIKTTAGTILDTQGEKVYVEFKPKGFSEFCVLHMKLRSGGERTLFVNPFTGEPAIYKTYKDFQWTVPGQNK